MFLIRKRNASGTRFFLYAPNMFYRVIEIVLYMINRPYYMNLVCPEFISNERVFSRDMGFRIFEFLLYLCNVNDEFCSPLRPKVEEIC